MEVGYSSSLTSCEVREVDNFRNMLEKVVSGRLLVFDEEAKSPIHARFFPREEKSHESLTRKKPMIVRREGRTTHRHYLS